MFISVLLFVGSRAYTQQIVRGPYLTMATQHSVVVCWRTDIACKSKVTYGLAPGISMGGVVNNSLVTDHSITLTGLNEATKYYYTIGTNTMLLQGDTENYFVTLPFASTTYDKPIRILAVGDVAKATTNEAQVRDAVLRYVDTNTLDGYLMLGDNAYPNGWDENFQTGFFDYFQHNITKHTILWPALGNHEYANDATLRQTHAIPYFDIFTLPTQAECGGVASNTESYYSFDIGNVHFVQLDSYGQDNVGGLFYGIGDTAMSPQITWLKQDLSANLLPWTIVSFHHPPYCKGTHDSDNESDLAFIREQLTPILERYNVDLVLNGHSHSYERSTMIHKHVGLSTSFDSSLHVVQSTSGRYDQTTNSCPYIKHSTPASPSDSGSIYLVIGSGSALPEPPQSGWPHQAMYYSNYLDNGALLLTIEGNQLLGEWISNDTNDVVKDRFVMYKNVNRTQHIYTSLGQAVHLKASWDHSSTYHWSTGDTVKEILFTPPFNQVITVTDQQGCLIDSFYIDIVGPTNVSTSVSGQLSISPNPAQQEVTIHGLNEGKNHLTVMDIHGKSLLSKDFGIRYECSDIQLDVNHLPNGLYFLEIKNAQNAVSNSKMLISR